MALEPESPRDSATRYSRVVVEDNSSAVRTHVVGRGNFWRTHQNEAILEPALHQNGSPDEIPATAAFAR